MVMMTIQVLIVIIQIVYFAPSNYLHSWKFSAFYTYHNWKTIFVSISLLSSLDLLCVVAFTDVALKKYRRTQSNAEMMKTEWDNDFCPILASVKCRNFSTEYPSFHFNFGTNKICVKNVLGVLDAHVQISIFFFKLLLISYKEIHTFFM